MAAGLFRVISGVYRTMIIANTGGSLMLLLVFLLGGFILPKRDIPNWWVWGYWLSPLSYAFNALSVNEIFAPWWSKPSSNGSTSLGVATLNIFYFYSNENWYWIGVGVLIGFTILYNVLFTLSHMYLNPIVKKQEIISEEEESEMEIGGDLKEEQRLVRQKSNKGNDTSKHLQL
ncbi:unnamed protein product [Lathyrus sativus]|nr:unnamed protein product [Lathyrus sativus]